MLVATDSSFATPESEAKTQTKLVRSDWGVTATQTSQQLRAVEILLRVMGSTFLFASSIFVLPIVSGLLVFDNYAQSEGLVLESLAVLTIAASGAALLYFSRVGVRKQIQVDSKRGEIRLGYLVKDGEFREKMCIAQTDLLSAFLNRSKDQSTPARLVFRLHNAPNPVVVFKGQETDLEPILNEVANMVDRTPTPKVRRKTVEKLFQVSSA